MATQLTIVNNVLRRLREDPVASVSENSYSQLLGIWVNDGITDITDRYTWDSLQHEVAFDLVAGQISYDLSATVSNGGAVLDSDRPTNEHSMLEWDNTVNKPVAFLFDSSSDQVSNGQMRLISDNDRNRKRQQDRSLENIEPIDFSLRLNLEGNGYDLIVWPKPIEARFVRVQFWTPQDELAIDGTDDNTSIIVNSRVVEAYVHMISSNERGEEMGEPGSILDRRYMALMGAAMEAPMRNEERYNRYESHRS